MIYSPDKPLSCGARVWIECDDAVAVEPCHLNGTNRPVPVVLPPGAHFVSDRERDRSMVASTSTLVENSPAAVGQRGEHRPLGARLEMCAQQAAHLRDIVAGNVDRRRQHRPQRAIFRRVAQAARLLPPLPWITSASLRVSITSLNSTP